MLEFLKQNKKIVIIVIIIIILIVGYFKTSKEDKIVEESQILNTSESVANTDENSIDSQIIVHIAGAVKKSGIVKLQEGSRIEDAIELAGGLSDNADITDINLAYVLEDGTKIRIPSKNDKDEQKEQYIIEDSGLEIEGDEVSSNNSSNNDSKNMVNINKAEQSDLESLPGIGPSLATRIIEYRKENGTFNDIEDIKNVSGIGDSKFSNIKSYIKVK